MRVGTDDRIAGSNKTFLGDKRVFYAHLTYVVEVSNFLVRTEVAAHLALFCSLYVLIGCEVIHNHSYLVFVKHAVFAEF